MSNGTCPNTSDLVILKINKKPALMVEKPEAICSGESIYLAADGAENFLWSPGDITGPVVEVSPMENTVYTIVGTSHEGCSDTTDIVVVVKPSPQVTLTASDYDVYIGDEVFLQVTGADYYTWNLDNLFGDHGSIVVDENTIVEVTGQAGNGCHGSDTVEIRILGYHALKIPEGYSPNADGIHDNFDIIGIEAFPSNNLKVFNRWGSLVFESDGYHNEWDGFSNSNLLKGSYKLPEGTYYYILDLGDGTELLSGFVYISR
jgi:gliding motility-associated-like protein